MVWGMRIGVYRELFLRSRRWATDWRGRGELGSMAHWTAHMVRREIR